MATPSRSSRTNAGTGSRNNLTMSGEITATIAATATDVSETIASIPPYRITAYVVRENQLMRGPRCPGSYSATIDRTSPQDGRNSYCTIQYTFSDLGGVQQSARWSVPG